MGEASGTEMDERERVNKNKERKTENNYNKKKKMCDPSRIGRCIVVVESMHNRYIYIYFVVEIW